MTFIQYQDKDFQQRTLAMIDQANTIIAEFQADNYTPTLRQLYYGFISIDYFPNSQKSYDKLGRVVTDARMAGLISWEGIEDRHRTCNKPYIQGDIAQVLDGIEYHYSPDLWCDQENYIEVWVEKEALGAVVRRAANQWDVAHMACKGYLSASEAWRASLRFKDQSDIGKRCHLIHLGDHDPSGMDMTRDNDARMAVFGADVEVHRVALNIDQVHEYNPPSNFAKQTDSRFKEYAENYGNDSWELDALKPKVIVKIIDDKIRELVDLPRFDDAIAKRRRERSGLAWISENAETVLEFADENMSDEHREDYDDNDDNEDY